MNLIDKSKSEITVKKHPFLILKIADQTDLELLRQWKNEQKQFFFSKEEISIEQQLIWYYAYEKRQNDFMFMTSYDSQIFGCMGIRWKENCWDVYNVILGLKEFGGRGLMSLTLKELITFALTIKVAPITLQVLKDNPAVNFYSKQGFSITETHETYFSMLFQSI
jgi:RimJ/RimL family protein N-acetyltransferase